MWKTKLVYRIYQLKNGLLLEPRNHWDEYYPMFPYSFDSLEDALQASAKEEHTPENLVILPQVYKYYDVE